MEFSLVKTSPCHTLWDVAPPNMGEHLVMGCDRLGSSCWTLCSLLGRFQRAGRDTKDFLSLGEGRDTEKFAQSLKQRASGSAVLESLGLAGVQGLLHTAAEYRAQPADISMDATQRTTVVTIQVFHQLALCNIQWHQLHIKEWHLLSSARQHMSRAPPSKSALFSHTSTAASWNASTQCPRPSRRIIAMSCEWGCILGSPSTARSDSDPDRANGPGCCGWQCLGPQLPSPS